MADAPGSGRMSADAHILPLRVYYEDTDAAGIVYYATYLRYAERARTEMLRLAGGEHMRLMREEGVAFAVRHCTADYLAPGRLDDAIEVYTRLIEVAGASLRVRQDVRRGGTDLVRLTVRLACMRRDGRPARLPAGLRAALAGLSSHSDRNAGTDDTGMDGNGICGYGTEHR